MASQDTRLSKFEADFKQQQSKMTNKIDTVLKAITERITGALLSDTVKNPKLNVNSSSPVLSTRSYPTEDPQSSTHIHSLINAITICSKQPNKSHDNKLGKNGIMKIGTKDEDHHTMVEDKVCKLNSFRVVKFTNGTNEIAYKMPHKIEQYNSLSDLEKKHTKSVYLRNEEDKRRGVDYVMNKILGFYKECLELGPEYLAGLEDEGGVTFYAAEILLALEYENGFHKRYLVVVFRCMSLNNFLLFDPFLEALTATEAGTSSVISFNHGWLIFSLQAVTRLSDRMKVLSENYLNLTLIPVIAMCSLESISEVSGPWTECSIGKALTVIPDSKRH
ncbi:hypothetical protein Tco_0742636 [Tanacetum coccineum]